MSQWSWFRLFCLGILSFMLSASFVVVDVLVVIVFVVIGMLLLVFFLLSSKLTPSRTCPLFR